MFKSKKILHFVIAACLLITSTTVIAQTWQSTNGPYRPQEVRDLSSAKVGSVQTIYAAAAETLKFTTNGGITWQNTASLMRNPLVVAVKQDDANILHVGKLGELHRSTNGGVSWEEHKIFDPNLVPLRLSVSKNSPDIWLLGTDTVRRGTTWTTSLYRSENGGNTWFGLTYFKDNARTNINDVIFHPSNNKVWVGGSRRPLSQTPDGLTDATIRTKGVWFSTNNGADWTFHTSQPGGTTHRNVSALAFSDDPLSSIDLLFAAVTQSDGSAILYQSADDGLSWATTANLFSAIGVSQVRALKVSNIDHNVIIAATDKGFAISTNRGVNWRLIYSGLEKVQTAYQVLFDMNDASGVRIYLASYPGIFISTDQGNTWSDQNGIFSFMNSSSFAINGTTAHSVSRSYSGVAKMASGTWDQIPKEIGRTFFSGEDVAINNTNTLFANACGDSAGLGVIYVRTDGSENWRQVFTSNRGDNSSPIYTVLTDPKPGSQRVYAGGNFRVSTSFFNFIRSTNLGVSWSSQQKIGLTDGVPVRAIAIEPSSGVTHSTTLYAGLGKNGGSGLGVRKSTDDGNTWSGQLNGHEIISIAVASSSVLYLGSPDKIWRSNDALVNPPVLLPTTFGAKQIIKHPLYPNSTDHVWVINSGGDSIFATANGGITWTNVTGNLPTPINDLSTNPQNNFVIYASTAGGVYKLEPPPAPVLASPSNNETGISISPTLSWNASAGATSYRLQVATNSDFVTIVYDNASITTTNQGVGPLNHSTTYYWRVNASNSFGTGNWSSAWQFTIPPPPRTPVLASPSNGATEVSISPTLWWQGLVEATSYRLQVATNSDFVTIVYDNASITTIYQLISTLGYSTTYYWRVNASNNSGTSPWSSVWHFTTQSAPPPPPPDPCETVVVNGITIQAILPPCPPPAYKSGYLQTNTASVPDRYILSQNHPNPFNPTTVIHYGLPEDAYVVLKVYDILGREFATLVDEFQKAGNKSVNFDASSAGGELTSGVYIYKIQAGKFHDVKKMILLR